MKRRFSRLKEPFLEPAFLVRCVISNRIDSDNNFDIHQR